MKKINSLLGVFALFFTLSFLIPCLSIALAATLIDDNFADRNSQNQDLANNSLRVFKGRTGTTRTDAQSPAAPSVSFNIANAGGAEGFWAFFTNTNSPVTLGVGDSLSVSNTFSLTGFNNISDIRFGVFDSKGTRNTADLTGGMSDSSFNGDAGYALQYNTGGTGSSAFTIWRRTTLTSTNIFSSAADFTAITGTSASPSRQNLVSDTLYTLTYKIERLSATDTKISVSVTDGGSYNLNYSATESNPNPNTTFDYFGFRVPASYAQAVNFTRLKIDYTPAIPAAPVITSQPGPAEQTVSVGSNVTMSVGASGSQLSYQWQKGGVPITGNSTAITPTLQLTNVQTGDSGAYTVVVSNPGGSVTSQQVILTVSDGPVEPSPIITQQPIDTTVTIGSPVNLSVAAVGNNLSYQWFKNNVLINGATSPTLNFTNAQNSDAADYTVLISNPGGSVTSNNARLTVVSAMTVTAFDPVSNSANVCTDAPLRLTFNQTPRVGNTGRIRIYKADNTLIDTIDMSAATQSKNIGGTNFNYYPILINGNTASIYPHVKLDYNTTYYVTLDTGVIKDAADTPFAGFSGSNTLRFTTKIAAPAAGTTALTVAADGTGNFCTVQGAIDFVPAGNTQRTVITVKNGIYREINYIASNKPFITVRGESREGTIIQYANNNSFNPTSTVTRTMFGVDAADFTLENITLYNTTLQGGTQAEALRTNGVRANIIKVNLKSFQDTLLTNKAAFITDSYIEGDVDFMWGNGATYFKNTEIKMMRENLGYYTQIRNGQSNAGNVYVNCRLTKAAGVTNGSYLSRIDPGAFPYSQVVFIDSQMDSHIIPVGWKFDNAALPVTTANYPNIRFWEYNTTDLNGNPADCSLRHQISRNTCNNPLTADEAAFYRNPVNVTGFTPQEKLTALVALNNSTFTYDGTPKQATATTSPAGLSVQLTYNGSTTPPTNAGTYTVVATVSDANYQGTATGTLTINPASASISLANLNYVYDGNAKQATVTTNPGGLNVTVTYNGSPALPVNPGSYSVIATVNDANYGGSATGILTIFPNRAKAFPGAEGYGAYALGGRNGDVYHVTNLNDSGAGSLREGIRTAPANGRTIVFDVSGTIYLQSRLNINKPNLTFAGQTAPGDGITVAGDTTVVNNTHDIIIRYMRFRAGDVGCPTFQGDSLWVDGSTDVIIDHVSASWSVDETLSVTSSNRVTVQWSAITESLKNSCHLNDQGTALEAHGYGSLLRYGNGSYSFHHNLFANHSNRNPRIGDNLNVDFVNNVVYNWSINAGYSGTADEGTPHINWVNNYFIAGPNTPIGSARTRTFSGGSANTFIYSNGNLLDGNVNGVRDGVNTGSAMIQGVFTLQSSRFDFVQVPTDDASIAYNRVIASAGRYISGGNSNNLVQGIDRDAVDARVLNGVTGDTGTQIDSQNQVGGYPSLNSLPAPTDTDGDGMPNAYETQNNLNPNDPTDAGTLAANGLTNLENYMNALVALSPTAATVAISGRVTNASGRGISKVVITLNGANGERRNVMTNPFGYYRFTDVPAGETYVVAISSKRYTFENEAQVVNLVEELTGVNFVANW